VQIVELPTAASRDDMYEVLDKLRAEVDSGTIVAFVGVGLTETDECRAFIATQRHVSRLRTYGAVSHLLHCLQSGEV
jgi:hypothetical protein